MIIDEENPNNFEQVYIDLKKYLILQLKLFKFESVEKLTVILTTFISIAILIILGTGALFYLLFALGYWLAPYVGGMAASFAIIGSFNLLIMIIVFIFRKKLILNPLVRFLSNLLLNDIEK